MSKFFTYEDRLSLQKYLKDSLSFKEIARRMDKNPGKCVNTVHPLPLGIPDFRSMPAKADTPAGRKRSVEKNAPVNQLPTASSVRPVMRTVPISWKKSVWQDFGFLIPATAVKALASVHF